MDNAAIERAYDIAKQNRMGSMTATDVVLWSQDFHRALSRMQRAILILLFKAGLSQEEVAHRLRMTQSNVSRQKGKIIKKAEKLLVR